MTKDAAPEELVRAIRRFAGGHKYITPELAEQLAMTLGQDFEEQPHERLSDREFQVMRLMASGKTVSEIAEELHLSVKTISTYRSRILEKMNLRNNAEIMQYAIKRELTE
jgi:DNA-binding NarL/FixJ family response regulator